MEDRTLYRTTIECRCGNDYAEGYGPIRELADANAWSFFLKNHKRHEAATVVTEQAVPHGHGGSHYEEVEA